MQRRASVLIIAGEPVLRAMLRAMVADDGYCVHAVPDAPSGLRWLRASSEPQTVLVEVVPVPHMTREESGLAVLDAVAQDAHAAGELGLARHTYVVLSTNPSKALALAGAVPLAVPVHVLAMPFRIETLLATLVEATPDTDLRQSVAV
jgi:CheY-like chemotaxis protein